MMNKFQELWLDSSSRKVIIIFSVMILCLVVALFFQQYKMQEEFELKVHFIEEKNILRDELDDLIDEHDDLLEEYGDLNAQLHDKDSVIQNQIVEIRNLIRTKNDLNEARIKIARLREISKRYLANIDSLLVINNHLTLVKDSVIKANKDINWKNYKLNQQNKTLNEKVSRGAMLEVLAINIEAIRYRRTGREISTRFAKKVQKLQVCFTVAANQMADSEAKSVHMQLIDPKGEIIQGINKANLIIADSVVDLTASAEFEYQNIEIESCFEWERVQQLEGGTYLVHLIIEGRMAASKLLQLR